MEHHQPHHYGADIRLGTRSEVCASLSLHPAGQQIDEHAHDFVTVTLFLAGSYCERSDAGEYHVTAPAAVIHPPGSAHHDRVGPHGLETIVLALDPAWLRSSGIGRVERSIYRLGQSLGKQARQLAHAWISQASSDESLLMATAIFLLAAVRSERSSSSPPEWLGRVQAHLAAFPLEMPDTVKLAAVHKLHPGWLLQSYQRHVGESMRDTVRRRRVELAAARLRGTDAAIADIALEAGFCDQSHMNRVFRSVLARSPSQVRKEGVLLRKLDSAARDAHSVRTPR